MLCPCPKPTSFSRATRLLSRPDPPGCVLANLPMKNDTRRDANRFERRRQGSPGAKPSPLLRPCPKPKSFSRATRLFSRPDPPGCVPANPHMKNRLDENRFERRRQGSPGPSLPFMRSNFAPNKLPAPSAGIGGVGAGGCGARQMQAQPLRDTRRGRLAGGREAGGVQAW